MPLKLHEGRLEPVSGSGAEREAGDNIAAASLADWIADDSHAATVLRLTPEDDVYALQDASGWAQRLERIELSYPAYTDGRAHTQAHILRTQLDFNGELRATGDVRLDQIPMMIRCGIDAFAFDDHKVEAAATTDAMQERLQRFERFYQHGYQNAAATA